MKVAQMSRSDGTNRLKVCTFLPTERRDQAREHFHSLHQEVMLYGGQVFEDDRDAKSRSTRRSRKSEEEGALWQCGNETRSTKVQVEQELRGLREGRKQGAQRRARVGSGVNISSR